MLTVLWVNGETEVDSDTTGGGHGRDCIKSIRSDGNPQDIMAIAWRELFYFSKPIRSYLSSRIIVSS